MINKTWPVLVFVLMAPLLLTQSVEGQAVNDRFLGTRWTTPGPRKAEKSPEKGGTYGKGEADWSEVPAGTNLYTPAGIEPAFPDMHLGASIALDQLTPGAPAGTASNMFKAAFDMWAAKSMTAKGGVKNLGKKVPDGGGSVGAPRVNEPMANTNPDEGDIRVAVFDKFPPIIGTPEFEVIAHAFDPDTRTQKLVWDIYGAIGGDVHFRPHKFKVDPTNPRQLIPSGYQDVVDWYWDPLTPTAPTGAPAPGQIDLFSVMLHEIGHALGLGHDNLGRDASSVMTDRYFKPTRTLSTSDIKSIRRLYAVPEPGAVCALWLIGWATSRRWRRSYKVIAADR